MSSRRVTASLAALAMAAALLAGGCRNPFMPDADVSIYRIWMPKLGSVDTTEMPVFAADFPGPTSDYTPYLVTVQFEVRNKVGVNITGLNVVFTDMAGNPVTSYAASGGKNLQFQARLSPDTDNYPGGALTNISLMILDRYVVNQLKDPSFSPKYINCELTFRGEDENGYDVKLTGRFSIKGLNF